MTAADSANGSSALPTAAADRESRVAAAFVSLADTLVSDFDTETFMQTLVSTCLEVFEVDAAGLLLGDARGRLRLAAFSSETARLVEVAQLVADEGPCLESFTTSAPVSSPEIAETRGRWPEFVRVASEGGLRSSYATPLRYRDQTIGTVNLFSRRPAALGPADLTIAQALGDVATIGILQQRLLSDSRTVSRQLQTALDSRIVIEQAKGVLATASNIPMSEAFRIMRDRSRRTNTPLQDVAAEVITRTLEPRPDQPTRP